MRDLARQALGQVDDLDRVERTALNTHTAANAHRFRDEANRGAWLNVNTHLTGLVEWARLGTLLFALLRLAFIGVDDCNS